MSLNHCQNAWLVLEDGTVLKGKSAGAVGTVLGEVVFANSCTGYQEKLTDPTYYGQILMQTFPASGNYGVNQEDNISEQPWVKGYIVREICDNPSNFRCEGKLRDFLVEHNVVAIEGIDTRYLTKVLREKGTMNGAVTTENPDEKMETLMEQIRSYQITNAVEAVTCTEETVYTVDAPEYRVVVVDFGVHRNIIDSLLNRECEVTVVPAMTTAERIAELNPQGILLSNGPGNPAQNPELIANVKAILALGIPVFAIGLGHQLVALASGAKVEKMKYGHRGASQPVKDLRISRIFATSQNHGYVVAADSINEEVAIATHLNVNDDTCEGFVYRGMKAMTLQFYPEPGAAACDTSYLYDEFIDMMK